MSYYGYKLNDGDKQNIFDWITNKQWGNLIGFINIFEKVTGIPTLALWTEDTNSALPNVLNTNNDYNDYVVALKRDAVINTYGGHDIVDSGAGNDKINAGSGNDIVYAGAGADSVLAQSGDDWVFGEAGADVLYGGAGNDLIIGDFQDKTTTADGNDKIYGEDGHDKISGGGGNDLLDGGNGHDLLEGGAGNDTLYGRAGNDVIAGDDGHDKIYGGDGNDKITGGKGDDLIDGGAGDDLLFGDAGFDTLYGGGGADTFLISTKLLDTDIIKDFSFTQGDKLDISEFLDTYDLENTPLQNLIHTMVIGNQTFVSIETSANGIPFDGSEIGIVLNNVQTSVQELIQNNAFVV